MEEQWYNPGSLLKPGLQDLLNHITGQLSPEIQEAILLARIGFIFDDRPLPLQTPVADLSTHRIIVQDIHLAFLWCCSYATVAINSMYYDKVELGQDIVSFNDRAEFVQVQLTLYWARTLQKEVTWWPSEAARPDRPDQWTEAATNLFQACVVYLLFHEIGHLILHDELKELMAARRQNRFYETSEADRKRIFAAELEADQFAIDALMSNSVLEEVRLVKYLGAVLAHLSNFYLLDVPDTRGGATHPDLDDRLRTVLQQADLRNEADQIQLRSQLVVGLQLFLTLTGKQFIPDEPEKAVFQRFEDLENHLFNLIAEMKKAARERFAH